MIILLSASLFFYPNPSSAFEYIDASLCFFRMSDLEAQSKTNEKTGEHTIVVDVTTGEPHIINISQSYLGKLGQFSRWLETFGVESRGFQRVLPEERTPQSFWGLCLIWYAPCNLYLIRRVNANDVVL